MTWLNPLHLLGLLAAGVPILLHLFGKRPAAVVDFPAVELLRRALDVRRRRNRWREILLLLLRVTFVAAVAAAVARPLLSRRAAAGAAGPGRDFHLLFDNSASMSAVVSRQSLLERARKSAEMLLARMGPGDRMSLRFLLDAEGRSVGLTGDRSRLAEALARIPVAYETGAILPWVAEWAAEQAEEGRARQLWIVTDGTAAPWKERAAPGRRPGSVQVLDVSGEAPVVNRGVRDFEARLEWEPDGPVASIEATLSGENAPAARIETLFRTRRGSSWNAEGRRFVELPAGGSSVARFSVPLSSEETVVCAEIEEDALAADNARCAAVSKPQPLSVGVYNGNPRPEPKEDAAFFVRAALAPKGALRTGPFSVTDLPAEGLSFGDLEGLSLVVLADAGNLPQEQVAFFERFARAGGGVLIGAGETFGGSFERRPVERLLPAAPRGEQTPPAVRLHLEKPVGAQTPFGFLGDRWEALLGGARFGRYLLVEPPPQGVWLRFAGGIPALVVSEAGKGNVAFWTSTLGARWNDLPLSAGYPAFLRALISALAPPGRQGRRMLARPTGARLEAEEFGPGAEPLSLTDEEGRRPERGEALREGWRLPDRPGLWKLRFRQEGETKTAYVFTEGNRAEFDLSRVDRREIEQRLAPLRVAWQPWTARLTAGAAPPVGGREVSEWLAALALFSFLAESFLSGRGIRLWRRGRPAAGAAALFLLLPGPALALGGRSGVEIGRLLLSDAESSPHARPLSFLLQKAVGLANLETLPDLAPLRPSDPRLFDHPFLYCAGDRAFPLPSDEELSRLRRHLVLGGFLLLDDAMARPGSDFHRSVEAMAARLFPGKSWQKLPPEHSIFRSYYLLDRPVGRRGPVELLGLDVDRRTAVVYLPGDLAGALETDAGGRFVAELEGGEEQRTFVLRLGINLLMYALTLDYKQDQIHIPFILRRRP